MFQRKDPAQLAAQLQAMKGAGSFNEADGKEWKLELDNAKNGTAVIRFLPGRTPESIPFVKLVNHGFKNNGKWYIENCTSTHGDFESCPVCKYISDNDLYNTDNQLYGKIKRKTSFWCNILVIKDPANPKNEGQVFKYRFGQKVMDKINAMIEVNADMGEIPVDVTCPFEGANFILKVKQVGGFSNYDECKFLGQSKIQNIEDEAYQKQLIDNMVDIDVLTAKDQFNSFEKNEETFKRIMGTAVMGGAAAQAATQADNIANELDNFEEQMAGFTATAQTDVEPAATPEPVKAAPAADPGLDDLLKGL
ncbi:single-stranded DNA binding protein [Acinetobacter phage Henu6]|jgi:hypothetical protein|uniref:Single-stranded DNA-binding protein n=2 Tax=Zedzedvirus zz1 TaxID=2843640 RepID=A0A410T539_9CAUD|nr:single-stranded DNA binding protein [Acinetobacter phage Henu6]